MPKRFVVNMGTSFQTIIHILILAIIEHAELVKGFGIENIHNIREENVVNIVHIVNMVMK
jgi:hypothetical protein